MGHVHCRAHLRSPDSYDSTSVGAAQLAYKAHLRTAKIKKLREIIAMGGKAFEALIKKWNGPPVPDERGYVPV
jgi:hypothetical protein